MLYKIEESYHCCWRFHDKKVSVVGKYLLVTVKIRSNVRRTTAALFNHIEPAVRTKADILIIHTGTNDHGEDLNTVKKV